MGAPQGGRESGTEAMDLGSIAGCGEEPEGSPRRHRGRGPCNGPSGANDLRAQGQWTGAAQTSVSGFGHEVVPGGAGVSRWGGGHSQMAVGQAGRAPLCYHLGPAFTVVSEHDCRRGPPGPGWGQRGVVAALAGTSPFPHPTEELGLSPGSSACWLEAAAPRRLSEPVSHSLGIKQGLKEIMPVNQKVRAPRMWAFTALQNNR